MYIAGACYDSLAKNNVKGRNRTRLYNIPVPRNHLGAELFLRVGIGEKMKFQSALSSTMEAAVEVKDYIRDGQKKKSRGLKAAQQPGPRGS